MINKCRWCKHIVEIIEPGVWIDDIGNKYCYSPISKTSPMYAYKYYHYPVSINTSYIWDKIRSWWHR